MVVERGKTRVEVVPARALLARCITPPAPFDPLATQKQLPIHLVDTGKRFLQLLWQAGDLAPELLPSHLAHILDMFPELRSAQAASSPFGDPRANNAGDTNVVRIAYISSHMQHGAFVGFAAGV